MLGGTVVKGAIFCVEDRGMGACLGYRRGGFIVGSGVVCPCVLIMRTCAEDIGVEKDVGSLCKSLSVCVLYARCLPSRNGRLLPESKLDISWDRFQMRTPC